MTLSEIKKTKKEFLNPADIATLNYEMLPVTLNSNFRSKRRCGTVQCFCTNGTGISPP